MDKVGGSRQVSRRGQEYQGHRHLRRLRGSEAVASGVLTADQLRGPQFRGLYRDVYLPAAMPVTHPTCCEGIALALPTAAVITGRSAAADAPGSAP